MNYIKRGVYVDPKTEKTKKTPSHSLFFIPFEVWAIIVPVFMLGMEHHQAETMKIEMTYIETPYVNDVYSVDFTEIFDGIEGIYKYGTLKVVSIESDGVNVISSDGAYDRRSGVNKDVIDGKVYRADYYSGEMFFMPTKIIKDLRVEDKLFAVSRK